MTEPFNHKTPFTFDAADKAAARRLAVEYATKSTTLCLLACSGQYLLGLISKVPCTLTATEAEKQATRDAMNDAWDLAAATSVCAFICWASSPPGAGGLP